MSAVMETNGDLEKLPLGIDEIQFDDSTVTDDNELAMQGIVLLLNNKWAESLALFEKYKSQSVIMNFGGAFVTYMQGQCQISVIILTGFSSIFHINSLIHFVLQQSCQWKKNV